MPEDFEVAGPIDSGRLLELKGQAQDELSDEERPKGSEGKGENEGRVAVDQSEVLESDV